MCLAYPGCATEIDGLAAHAAKPRASSVWSAPVLLQEQAVQVGDFVIVHLGTAIGTVPPEEARSAWRCLLDELLALIRRSARTPPGGPAMKVDCAEFCNARDTKGRP